LSIGDTVHNVHGVEEFVMGRPSVLPLITNTCMHKCESTKIESCYSSGESTDVPSGEELESGSSDEDFAINSNAELKGPSPYVELSSETGHSSNGQWTQNDREEVMAFASNHKELKAKWQVEDSVNDGNFGTGRMAERWEGKLPLIGDDSSLKLFPGEYCAPAVTAADYMEY
jgi:hypothetical protein